MRHYAFRLQMYFEDRQPRLPALLSLEDYALELCRLEKGSASSLVMKRPWLKVRQALLSDIRLTMRRVVIEADGETLPWAAAGSTVQLYLSGIDPIHLR